MKAKRYVPGWAKTVWRCAKARLNPIPLRYGPDFMRYYEMALQSQWWTEDQLREYQWNRLNVLVGHAWEHVPYYRRTFKACGFEPGDLKSFDNLRDLPLLTKEDVFLHYDELIASNSAQWFPKEQETSGSSGKPLRFLADSASMALERAMVWRHWSWAGYAFGQRRATFRQYLTEDKARHGWTVEPEEHNLGFYSFDVDGPALARYWRKLASFRPVMVRGYPSYLTVLARHAGEHSVPVPDSIKSVVCSSEMLYQAQREEIEAAFGCPVFNWYGCGEKTVNACECERQEGLHVNMERGVVELLKDGRYAAAGEAGEVVATALDNFAMPFIRYRVGDVAVWKGEACSCGRGAPLLDSIEGRDSDILRARDGRYIFPAGIIDVVENISAVKETQLVQREPGRVTIRVVPRPSYSVADGEALLDHVRRALGRNVDVSIETVASIERSPSGKYRWVISEMDPGYREQTRNGETE